MIHRRLIVGTWPVILLTVIISLAGCASRPAGDCA